MPGRPSLPTPWLLPFLAGLVALSCSTPVWDLGGYTVHTVPGTDNEVLPAGSPLKVQFSPRPRPSEAVNLVKVSSPEGNVSGDLRWDGDTLIFQPVPDLVAGRLYTLALNGQLSFDDGTPSSVNRVVHFYAGSATAPGRLVGFTPADGESVAVDRPLVLSFGEALDEVSFQAGFTVNPSVEVTKQWSADATSVTVRPRQGWAVGTLYTWQVDSGVVSSGGVPLARSYKGSFLTDADTLAPVIDAVVPCLWVPASSAWAAAGADLGAFRRGDALLVRTNRPVDLSSLDSAFQTSPSVKGHWLAQGGTESVFVPDEEFLPRTDYTVTVTTALKDLVGHPLARPWTAVFQVATPPLGVVRIDLIGDAIVSRTALNQVNDFPVVAPVAPVQQLLVRVVFDAPLAVVDRGQFSSLSFCEPLFPLSGPTTLDTPVLTTVAFESDRTVVLTYQGFSVNPAAGAPYFYQFKVPGGSGGVTTSAGPSLKEDVWLAFATGS